MTTGELIKLMQEADPDGTMEVTVDNLDVYFVEPQEGYYDGRLQRLIIDESKRPYYSVAGAKVTGKGWKLRLHTMGVRDVIENDPDAPVDLSDLEGTTRADWERWVAEWREETRRVNAEVDQWMKERTEAKA